MSLNDAVKRMRGKPNTSITLTVVRKGEAGGRTVARAAIVDGEDRVSELSRMLAGVEESSHARRHAEELLARAVPAR